MAAFALVPKQDLEKASAIAQRLRSSNDTAKRGRGRPRKGMTPDRLLRLAKKLVIFEYGKRRLREQRKSDKVLALKVEAYLKSRPDYSSMLRRDRDTLLKQAVGLGEQHEVRGHQAEDPRLEALYLAAAWRMILNKYGAVKSASEIPTPPVRVREGSDDTMESEEDALDAEEAAAVIDSAEGTPKSGFDLLAALAKSLRKHDPLAWGTIGKRGIRKVLDLERLKPEERSAVRELARDLLKR